MAHPEKNAHSFYVRIMIFKFIRWKCEYIAVLFNLNLLFDFTDHKRGIIG